MKTALFLDFDGTLVDSISALHSAYLQFLREFNIEGSTAEFQEFNGPPLPIVVAELKKRYDLREPELELFDRYLEIIDTSDTQLQLAPGAGSLLTAAQTLGIELAIVTSSPVNRVSKWLDRHQLESMFQCVIGADSTEFGKPHADPYLLALQKLNVTPDQAITVEDSAKGAAASLAAEITTILLGSHPDTLEHALLIPMKSLDDVTWYLQLGA
ncbi:HAD family phosphatase [Arsukibacterium sp.]|uniref:HAD family hydrolase n=1 Tax=Arsukibacterium sp. TaxID=1977258 RepID=UPI001BD24433|nr:HAD family phosphatase [Arsukibacterium sp.]